MLDGQHVKIEQGSSVRVSSRDFSLQTCKLSFLSVCTIMQAVSCDDNINVFPRLDKSGYCNKTRGSVSLVSVDDSLYQLRNKNTFDLQGASSAFFASNRETADQEWSKGYCPTVESTSLSHAGM